MKTKILIPLLAGVALLCACKGKFKSETADSSSSTEMVKRKSATIGDTVQKPKLIKTADINFEVKNVQQTSENIATITNNCNGMVVHHLMGSTAGHSEDIRVSNDSIMRVTSFNTTAEMTVKIPPAKMEDFINQVTRLGTQINNLKMDINDKTLDYQAAQLKLKNREAFHQHKNDNSEGELNVKDDLIDRQVNNLKIADSAKRSTITLSFYENSVVKKKVIANDNLSAYNPPFFKRLGLAIENGWGILVDIFIELANVWILLPVGIGAWVVIKRIRNKKAVEIIKS